MRFTNVVLPAPKVDTNALAAEGQTEGTPHLATPYPAGVTPTIRQPHLEARALDPVVAKSAHRGV